jgi:hypothetical protein
MPAERTRCSAITTPHSHHGTWFQTTIDRPHIFEFEDSERPLPIHSIGIAAMGKIPSGSLGLHWLAEVATASRLTRSKQQ